MSQVILPNLVLFLLMIGVIVAVAVFVARRSTRPRDHRWPGPPPAPPNP